MSATRAPLPAEPSRVAALVVPVFAAVAALTVFRGTLAYFFAQDDFAGLARGRGLLPALEGPWRYISGQLYFAVMARLAGLDPLPYRAVSLAAHAATAALLGLVLRRWQAPYAALIGAVFFAVHPALFTAIYSVSGIGEILAGLFAIATIWALLRGDAVRWVAVPAFVLSLVCKESTVLLPVAALVMPRPRDETPARRTLDPVVWALMACAALYIVSFVVRGSFGIRGSIDPNAAYAVRFDSTLIDNLLTYAGWAANFTIATVGAYTDAVDRSVFLWGSAALVAVGLGCLQPSLRARGFAFGVAIFIAFLLPVLPLAHHTYHYYLSSPLLGAGIAIGAVSDWALAAARRAPVPAPTAGRKARTATAPLGAPLAPLGLAATVAVVAALIVNGALLVRKIEMYPFIDPELRSEAVVDRARIARNVYDDLRSGPLPANVTLRFWSPASIERERDAGHDAGVESYWERNVRSALLDGLGVRVMFPAVKRVEFVRAFEPAGDTLRWAVYLPTGRLKVADSAELGAVLRARSSP